MPTTLRINKNFPPHRSVSLSDIYCQDTHEMRGKDNKVGTALNSQPISHSLICCNYRMHPCVAMQYPVIAGA